MIIDKKKSWKYVELSGYFGAGVMKGICYIHMACMNRRRLTLSLEMKIEVLRRCVWMRWI